VVIDHVVGMDYRRAIRSTTRKMRFSAGYLFNFGGKLKQARLFLKTLAEQRILTASAERFATPSRWERMLPPVRAEPRMLSAEKSEEVREELFSNDELEAFVARQRK